MLACPTTDLCEPRVLASFPFKCGEQAADGCSAPSHPTCAATLSLVSERAVVTPFVHQDGMIGRPFGPLRLPDAKTSRSSHALRTSKIRSFSRAQSLKPTSPLADRPILGVTWRLNKCGESLFSVPGRDHILADHVHLARRASAIS